MSTESEGIDGRTLRMIGGGSAMMNTIVFIAIGVLVLDSSAYGVIMGLFAGTGTFLFLPWIIGRSADQNARDDRTVGENVRGPGSNTQMGVFGLGLELGAIAMLSIGFVETEPNLTMGLGVAVGVALAISLVLSVLVNR
ncbi:hypothetical protein [Natrinema halophilum]|uniref:Uncharacterized protein n=1 Tax=Natrinema halophilum TaxID=1699371 RepID=A0A7D5KJX8_9EURY|nr:hypothetical protein [Natrinema halophilum]QLG49839.1 hypothetical protein HYG82_13725 [Natrinema halophilum]